jgi:NAD+ kinase
MPALRSLGFVVHQSKPGALELAEQLIKIAQSKGVITDLTLEYPIPKGFMAGQEACAVIGGDGTILSVLGEAVAEQVPIFGINQGHLGFLAGFQVDQILEKFAQVLDGKFVLDHRPILQAQFPKGQTAIALNEIAIKQSFPSRLITLAVHAQNEYLTHYAGDGLIFSTPTGSTAYSLSAGGPIVHPSLKLITMTPICPHTWSNRSLIFPPDFVLKISLVHEGEAPMICIDGQAYTHAGPLLPLEIRVAQEAFPLLQPHDHSFFKTLRSKLKWGDQGLRIEK